MNLKLITWGRGGSYYLRPVQGGYQLAHDPQGRQVAAYGYVYASAEEARAAAHSYATP